MKNRILVVVISLFLLLHPSVVSAHFLKTDGDIGALLHIDPDDDPIARSQSTFIFEFKDKQNKFSSSKCDCTFTVLENGQEITNQPLFQSNNDTTTATVSYTFPQKDVYQVKVTGKPAVQNAFQPFTVVWDIRVDKEASGNNKTTTSGFFTNHLLHIISIGFFFIIIIGYFIKTKYRSADTKIKKNGKSNEKDNSNIY